MKTVNGTKCNFCHRKGYWKLKLTFAQAKGRPRYAITFETQGFFCNDCKERQERMARDRRFLEMIGGDTRGEVEVVFSLRGWGPVQWEDTVAEFERIGVKDALTMELKL